MRLPAGCRRKPLPYWLTGFFILYGPVNWRTLYQCVILTFFEPKCLTVVFSTPIILPILYSILMI